MTLFQLALLLMCTVGTLRVYAQGATSGLSGQPFIPPTLTWNYTAPKPDAFLVERSIDSGATWVQVARLPGQRGKKLTWKDTTLAPMTSRVVVQWRVRAETAGKIGGPSNVGSATLGPPAPGECLLAQPDALTIVTICTLP